MRWTILFFYAIRNCCVFDRAFKRKVLLYFLNHHTLLLARTGGQKSSISRFPNVRCLCKFSLRICNMHTWLHGELLWERIYLMHAFYFERSSKHFAKRYSVYTQDITHTPSLLLKFPQITSVHVGFLYIEKYVLIFVQTAVECSERRFGFGVQRPKAFFASRNRKPGSNMACVCFPRSMN